jgi:TRAP transporter TAXI family solute receptor
MLRKATWIGLVLVMVLAVTPGVFAKQQFLRMVSGPEGGSWYPLGAAMMTLIQQDTGITSSNGPGGGVGNCNVVEAGRAEIGWSYTHTVYNAYNARANFKQPEKNIRYLISLYPGVFQMAVPRKSDIQTVADLKDKNIVPGKVGFTGTEIAELVLKAYGLTFDSIRQSGGSVSFVGYSDAAALMKDGHSQCYMAVTSCPQSTIIDLNFQPGVRFLGIDDEHWKKIHEMEPGLMRTEIPASAYKGLTAPVPTVGTVTCLIVNKDVPDDVVYNIVKSLYAHWEDLKQVKKQAIEETDTQDPLKGNNIPVHPGALKFYKEKGLVK